VTREQTKETKMVNNRTLALFLQRERGYSVGMFGKYQLRGMHIMRLRL
jgi:hypothetical protein